MIVVYWQLAVAGTVAVGYFVARALGWLPDRAVKASFAVAVGWSLFTFATIWAVPLIAIQLGSAWGAAFLVRHLFKTNEKLYDLRTQLDGLAPETIRQLEGLNEKQPLEIIKGREHLAILRSALDEAQTRICILSGWARSAVVDRDFDRRLRSALARRVDIYIGFGWRSSDPRREREHSETIAIERLKRTAAWASKRSAGQLFLADFPNHSKMLICDQRYAVCGSNNWLSNAWFRNGERSWKVTDMEFVGGEADEISRLIIGQCVHP